MGKSKERPAPPLLIAQLGTLYLGLRKECEKIFRKQDFPLDMDQIPVLAHLYYGGPSSQQEIFTVLHRDKASVNRTVAFLTKHGMATVTTDPIDRRKTIVKLTPTGLRLAKQANAVIENYDASLSSVLTKAEREQFHVLMGKLIAKNKSADSSL